jgi:predicted 3-demethylubiquinone-9 3-methyltransferase (glyoxalase superfamily)
MRFPALGPAGYVLCTIVDYDEALLMDRIAPCLWFDHQAEEAATFYVSIFKNSKITAVSRYTKAGIETHHRPVGRISTITGTSPPQGGDPNAQMCGWLKDRYGVSWQVTPRMMSDLFKEHTSGKAERAMEAMLRRVRGMALRLRFPFERRRYHAGKGNTEARARRQARGQVAEHAGGRIRA